MLINHIILKLLRVLLDKLARGHRIGKGVFDTAPQDALHPLLYILW